jgi:hypothetical protein
MSCIPCILKQMTEANTPKVISMVKEELTRKANLRGCLDEFQERISKITNKEEILILQKEINRTPRK